MDITTTRVLRDRKNSRKALQLKKKLNYVVIKQKNKGGGGGGEGEVKIIRHNRTSAKKEEANWTS